MKNIGAKILNILKKITIAILALVIIGALLFAFYVLVDFAFAKVLSFTARAVLANFIVFASIIFIIANKVVKPSKLLEEEQQNIKEKIEKSEKTKTQSQQDLEATQERIKKIDEEIEAIVKKFENNANQVGKRILQDAKKATVGIEDDTQKTIKNNQIILKNDIIKKTSSALIEIAKNQIIEELNKNPDLHNKLIEESIKTIVLNEQETEKV